MQQQSRLKKRQKGQKEEVLGTEAEIYWGAKNQILAIGINITKAALKKKLKITGFNYDKKSHYINNYTKSPKN